MRMMSLVLFPVFSLSVLIGCGDGDGERGVDAATPPADASSVDGGGAVEDGGGSVEDGGEPARDGGGGTVDGGAPDADVDVTFGGGCGPDFSGDVVVVRNAESIAVSATSGGALGGSIQLALQDERGRVELSTQHRVDTGAVVNVVAGTTWTNIARDSGAVLGEGAPDPIGGALQVDRYDEAAGEVDVRFEAVTLQNPSDGTICTLNGRLRTYRLSF